MTLLTPYQSEALDIVLIVVNFNLVDHAVLNNQLLTAQAFVTCAATQSATFLISYRIYVVSKQSIPEGSRRRIRRTLDILLQSAAVYSVVAIGKAVTDVIPQTPHDIIALFPAANYIGTLFNFISVGHDPISVFRALTFSFNSRVLHQQY